MFVIEIKLPGKGDETRLRSCTWLDARAPIIIASAITGTVHERNRFRKIRSIVSVNLANVIFLFQYRTAYLA